MKFLKIAGNGRKILDFTDFSPHFMFSGECCNPVQTICVSDKLATNFHLYFGDFCLQFLCSAVAVNGFLHVAAERVSHQQMLR